MKTLKILVATGLTLASAASLGVPGDGLKGTAHDWSGRAQSVLQWVDSKGVVTTYVTGTPNLDPVTGLQTKVSISIGMCTKCHTPHQAKSTNLLWNHTLMSTNYEWNVPATTAGTAYPKFKGDTYKGASTKCLSCHDGLMASTDGMWFNRQKVTGSAYVCNTATSSCLDSGHEVAHGARMSGSHPVAFPYPYENAVNAYNGTATGTAATLSEFVANPTTKGIRLFNDDGAGNIIAGVATGRTGMECTSCHDVHNGAGTKDVMLLRGKLTGSDAASGYICTQCHNK
jgi:nitrate reductase cytochrome c-type subunit